MNNPGDDDDLEKYLDGGSDLSRRYAAAATEEPPTAIDAAILARARAVTETLPSGVTRLSRRRPRWAVPFAVAATVLLSFAIFREAGMKSDFVFEESVAPNDQAVSAAPSLVASAPTPAPAAGQVPLTATALSDEPEVQVAEARREAPVQTKTAERVASADSNAESAASPAALAVAPPEPVEREAAEIPARDATRAAALSRPPPAAPAASARSEADVAQESRTPEAWLDEIRKFRADGEITAADAQLKLFLETYPDYFETNPDIARP